MPLLILVVVWWWLLRQQERLRRGRRQHRAGSDSSTQRRGGMLLLPFFLLPPHGEGEDGRPAPHLQLQCRRFALRIAPATAVGAAVVAAVGVVGALAEPRGGRRAEVFHLLVVGVSSRLCAGCMWSMMRDLDLSAWWRILQLTHTYGDHRWQRVGAPARAIQRRGQRGGEGGRVGEVLIWWVLMELSR